MLGQPILQQSLLLAVLDRAPALVFVADAEMRYLAVNATACKALGYTREELLSLRVSDVAVAEDAVLLYGEMVDLGEHSGRTLVRAKDGTTRLLRYEAATCEIAGMTYYSSVGFVEASPSNGDDNATDNA